MAELKRNSNMTFDRAGRKNSLNLQKARVHIQLFQLKIMCEFENKLKKYFVNLFQDAKLKLVMSNSDNSNKSSSDNSRNDANIGSKKKRGPYKKVFEHRNSILTDLYQNKHISTIYNIFIAFLIFLITTNILYSWRENGILSFGFLGVAQKFDKIQYGFVAWLYNMSLTFLVYPLFKIWSKAYRSAASKPILNTVFITMFTTYAVTVYWISTHICLKHNLPIITSMALMLETIRISMKSYGYIRTNAERVITTTGFISPTEAQFAYYFFCPTLLYRDSYPRTKSRDWKLVFKYLMEFLTIIYTLSLTNDCFLAKTYIDYGKSDITLLNLVISLFEITSIMTVIFFYGFYCLQHAWMNMFAELLQFGDRVFYKDWWNATSMKEFYRTWNITVHEWLYEYIFTDFYNHITKKSVGLSALATIVISGIFHEFAISITLRFFYPVLLAIYLSLGFMFMYVRVNKRLGNILVWFQLILGLSLVYALYSMEHFARINCPIQMEANSTTVSYYFTSATFKCNNIII